MNTPQYGESHHHSERATSAADDASAMQLPERASATLGPRLRVAREARNLSRAEVASRLKLPLKLIEKLEYDDYAGLTDGIFLRGYLSSYARLVGLPIEQATSVAAAHTQHAPLVATGTISRSRYLFDRYSVSATYLVLTAIIVVPAVWLATHGGLEQNLARTLPLDPPAKSVPLPAREIPAPSIAEATTPAADAVDSSSPPAMADQAPVIASMTPFVMTSPAAPGTSPSNTSVASDTDVHGSHTLSLQLSQQSWVEISAADGRKLEYGMLPAGSERTYRSDGPLSVRLGNVQGAQLVGDGTTVDLMPFQRGNVAHVKLFGDNDGKPAALDR